MNLSSKLEIIDHGPTLRELVLDPRLYVPSTEFVLVDFCSLSYDCIEKYLALSDEVRPGLVDKIDLFCFFDGSVNFADARSCRRGSSEPCAEFNYLPKDSQRKLNVDKFYLFRNPHLEEARLVNRY